MGRLTSPKWLLATTAVMLMTQRLVMTSQKGEANFAILFSFALPEASVSYTNLVEKKCQCVTICRSMNKCKVLTLQNLMNNSHLCQMSDADYSFSSLVSSQDKISITWLDYTRQGQRYYRAYSQKSWFRAFDHCRAEGGQLAVANGGNEAEVAQFMEGQGLTRAWVGLFRNDSASRPQPAWLPRNGNIIYEIRHAQSSGIRCFTLTKTSQGWITTNAGFICRKSLPYICQRN